MNDLNNILLPDGGEPEKGKEVTSTGRKRRTPRDGLHAGARSRYFALLLYPDNPDHREIYEWIVERENFISILHQPEDGTDGKPHYHVILHFDNARTLNGMKKYFANLIDNFIKICTDPVSFAQYMLHDTFECKKKGKKLYSLQDVQGTTHLKNLLYASRKVVLQETYVTAIVTLIRDRQITSMRRLVNVLLRLGLSNILSFVISHSFFVRQLLLPPEIFDGYGNETPEQQIDDKDYGVISPAVQDILDRFAANKRISGDKLTSDYVSTSFPEVYGKHKK